MQHRLWSGVILWPLAAACAASPCPHDKASGHQGAPAQPHSSETAQSTPHHHHHHGAANTVEDGDVRAEFEVATIAQHQAMAKEMGIHWTPQPDKDSHLSVTLSGPHGESLQGLPVELSITDPRGQVTEHLAEVMSAPGMYHYGIDFLRTAPGSYGVKASFERDGRKHVLSTAIPVP